MQNTKYICRLCFAQLDSGFELVDYMKKILEVLLINVNFAVSENPAICRNCTDFAWRAFTFKSRCISTEETILSYAVVKKVTSLDMKWIYNTKIACEVTENNNVCRFCMACVGEGNYLCLENNKCLPGNKLEQFLPEIEFNTIRPVVCVPCVDLLTNYFKFASTSASVEEVINKYCQQEGTNSNGFVNFNDVIKFSHGETARCAVTCNESVIKKTLFSDDDSDFKEFDIKIEEHDVKDEVCIDWPNESQHFAEDSKPANLENGVITHALCSDLRYECPLCQFKTETKADLRSHVRIHIIEPNAESIGDVACVDKSDDQSYLKRHVAVREKSIVVETYESGTCDFTAKCRAILKNHSAVHSSETFKRDSHELETKLNFKKGRLQKHKNASWVQMHRCDKCGYKTKYQAKLNRHSLVHKTTSEVTMYKCCKCEFKTKYKGYLNIHSLVHKKASEITMYKCCKCKFKTKRQANFKLHSLVHKNASEVTMYTCCKCEYKTKNQSNLKRHSLVHNNASEVAMYKCCKCEYRTRDKSNFKRHGLIHESASEVTMYKCCKCEFKTKHKRYLKRHSLVHKKASEITMYKCCKCEYKTKHKRDLKRHSLVHENASEVTMYKCCKCEFKTKYQTSLKKHSLKCIQTEHKVKNKHRWSRGQSGSESVYRCVLSVKSVCIKPFNSEKCKFL